MARCLADIAHDRFEPLGIVASDPLSEAAENAEERGGLGIGATGGRRRLDLLHQFPQARGIPHDLDEQPHAAVVHLELRRPQRGGDDLVERSLLTLLLAQDFGVVDLLDLEARPAGGGPQLRDSAIRPHFFRGPRQEQQQSAPGRRVRARIERHGADEVSMQQGRELGDCRVGLGGNGAVHGQTI